MAAVTTAERCVPHDLGGSWETSVTRPGGDTISYILTVLDDNPITEMIFCESGQDHYVEYSGIMGYVGMDETGMVYGYTLTGPDGNDIVGALSLLPQGGSLLVGVTSGEDLLETTDCLEFEPSFG